MKMKSGVNGKNCLKAVLLFVILFVCVLSLRAQGPSLTFYVPFPEGDALTALSGINSAAVNPMQTYISIAAVSDGTLIIYDQWEDGYEPKADFTTPQQSTTQIWGDGDPSNGAPPNVPSDIINAGTVILLFNSVDTTNPVDTDFDARDKIISNRSISMTRTYWASKSSTLFSGCLETFDTDKWGTQYFVPIGENIPATDDYDMFEYTALSIMARHDNTTVQIDADNNGVFETTINLDEGETYFVDGGVNVGGKVLADKPVQVVMFSGDVGSNYESRGSNLLPYRLWDSSFYTPVSTPDGDATRVWLYNPHGSQITVNYTTRIGSGSTSSGSVTVPAGSYNDVELPEGAAAHFYTTGSEPVFYAFSTTDSDDNTNNSGNYSDNQAWDWGFTLISEKLLSPQILIGLGIGRDPLSNTNPNEDGNPVWITTVGNGDTSIPVYVDYNGDNDGAFTDPNGNKYDFVTNIVELEQLKIYDPDGDQTAMLIYVLSTNVTLAGAWGQDTTTATAGEPGLDVGTSLPPQVVIDNSKELILSDDADSDGQLSPEDEAEYIINIGNTTRAPMPADVIITDYLPVDTTYVTGSTEFRIATNATWSSVSDDTVGTAFPLDDGGFLIQTDIPVAGTFQVRYRVDVDAYVDLEPTTTSIINTGSVYSVVYDREVFFKNETPLHGSIGDRVWLDADNDGVQDPGENGINDVLVYMDLNTNGVFDAGEPSDITSGDGDYLLYGTYLEAGDWQIRVDTSTLPSADYAPSYDLDGISSANSADVSLASGQDRLDVDFGYFLPAEVGDYVWIDTNGDGVQDAGEDGIENARVYIDSNNNDSYDTGEPFDLTDADGLYLIENIPAGSYNVRVDTTTISSGLDQTYDLDGTLDDESSVTLSLGESRSDLDFGYRGTAALSDRVWNDLNGDGVQDAGETGIGGVLVYVDTNGNGSFDGATEPSATTGANGIYYIGNLLAGTYDVLVDTTTLPSGFAATYDLDGGLDSDASVSLTAGQIQYDVDFGYREIPSALQITKVSSAPVQGLQEGETNTYTITVSNTGTVTQTEIQIIDLLPSTMNYVSGSTTVQYPVASTISVGDGFSTYNYTGYTGTNLWNDDWVENEPDDNNQTDPDSGYIQLETSGATSPRVSMNYIWDEMIEREVDLSSFPSAILSFDWETDGLAANETMALMISTNSTDWVELSTFGLTDSGTYTQNISSYISATTIIRFDNTGDNWSGADDIFYFDNIKFSYVSSGTGLADNSGGANPQLDDGVPPNMVTVADSFQLEAGQSMTVTFDAVVVDQVSEGVSSVTNTAGTRSLQSPGWLYATVDDPLYGTGDIGDYIWQDRNGDGVQDANEPGLANVRVYIDVDGDDTYDAGEPTAVTDSNGAYLISGLDAGSYSVRVDTTTLPAASTQTYDLNGALDNEANVTLGTGQSLDTADFGYRGTASLGDYVWDDVNGDGVQDGGESGLSGVRVYIDSNDNGAFDTGEPSGTTAGDGSYTIDNLLAETNVVRVDTSTLPAGYGQTYDLNGDLDHAADVPLAGGENRTDVDFGYQQQNAAIGDYVWYDIDGNGIQDQNESGLSGATVTLYDNNDTLLAVTSSDGSGAYAFTNLAAGTYYVVFTPPAGYTLTRATDAGSDDTLDSDAYSASGRTAPFSISAGEVNNTIDAGMQISASLTGSVFVDVDGDGVPETEDTNGIASVTILLQDDNQNTLASTITDSNGAYSFDDIAPGDYVVVQVLPTGYTNTHDVAGANDLRIPQTLENGQDSTDNDFYDSRDGSATIENKVLYLSDPAQALDRIDPVATSDSSTATTGTLTPAAIANEVVMVDNISTNTGEGVTSVTVSHTTGTGDNRLMLVGISLEDDSTDAATITGVTYGGTPLTRIARDEQREAECELWSLTAPASGTANVVVSLSNVEAEDSLVVGVTTFTGVDQSTPLGTAQTANGNSTAPSVNLSSTTDDLVFGVLSADDGRGDTPGANQTTLWTDRTETADGADGIRGAATTEAGGGTTTVSWTIDALDWWAVCAVPVRSAGAGLSAMESFTQDPVFALPFTMLSGAEISVTNYINVSNGTMPANPDVTAYLISGGTPFLTMDSPTYSGGVLVWNGTLGSDVAISAGESVTLVVSNVESSVEFEINYDSSTYPSRIILPTPSIIEIPAMAVYDASYSGGIPVDSSPVTETRYIRFTVTDPFGAYDITGATLDIDGPGSGGDINETLDAAYVVASDSYSKTYEYEWNTTALEGVYHITITADEGSEGIQAQYETDHTLYYAEIGDRVFSDYNNNGAWDAGEGLSGVDVTLQGDLNGDGSPDFVTVQTSADGYYIFEDLRATAAGVPYTVTVDTTDLPSGLTINSVDPDGGFDSTSQTTLTIADPVDLDQDFGYRSPALYKLSGEVRDDFDLDGQFSDPDLPVGGVPVQLYSDPNGDGDPSDGVVLASTNTLADGYYEFTGLIAGNYVVVETDPVYSVSTADVVGSNDNIVPITIVSSDSTGNDFLDAVDPSGYLYDVADGRIVPGGLIEVTGVGADVLMDGSSGQYNFISTNLTEATFTLAVTPPPGYVIDPTRPAQPGSFDPTGGPDPTVLGSYENSANPGYLVNYSAESNTYYYVFTLAPNDPPVINNNFPLVKVITIGDFVWEDVNGNGVQDGGEPGVSNVVVRLLDASNAEVTTTVTDENGAYLFTDQPPADYRVEFTPPVEYVFTVQDSAAATDATDSDVVPATGLSPLTSLAAGETNLTVDAGLYTPAELYGYLFEDENDDQIRNSGDTTITNALVSLIVNGVAYTNTYTDQDGYYEFLDIPVGVVTVQVVQADATLVAVPASSDPMRNRAISNEVDTAVIDYSITSGYGVLAANPGEPLNFGYLDNPLSTRIDLRAYATSDGRVMIEVSTVNENGNNDIEIYAMINGEWVMVAMVPSGQIFGSFSHTYTVEAVGLTPGQSYMFKIVDESGHIFYTDSPVKVTKAQLRATVTSLSPEYFSMTFNTEPFAWYMLMVSESLSGDAGWTSEYVQVVHPAFPDGVSGFFQKFQGAPDGFTTLRVPRNRDKAFFKLIKVHQ